MNDVKYLCEVSLDAPAPPLRDASTALAIARRDAARRTRVLATAGLAGAAALAAVVTPTAMGSPALVADAPAQAPSPSAVPSSSAPPVVRDAQAAATDDRNVYARLVAALPAGYTARTQYPFATDNTRYPIRLDGVPAGESVLIPMTVSVLVSDGSGEGRLWAYMANDGKPTPSGDLCAPPALQPLDGEDCVVKTIGGVAVRVTTQRDEDGRPITVARRYLRGGWFEVIAAQKVELYSGDSDLPPDAKSTGKPDKKTPKPALAAPFLTRDQVAALAADPAMLP
ncbi:hypothetical protein KZZ52_20730 [Dactylosporangium sp. AC04546]|uniref:hypothetical protein n=1 Tax=Dactylosporangium sp. AC04546 TaxID=2862460 RepID=UPI001EDD8B64|nr:hypothetical protein [Dactylosporangium sp. AC04546]WVK87716.1 hypothetical protein KZZ52_20730 [Dactylosporangium sp. AC04546]